MDITATQDISVCLSFDSNYAPHGDATITSIIENCSAPEKLHFYILHDNKLRPDVREQLVSGRKQRFTFLEVKAELFDKFPKTLSYINVNTYYRLLLQDLLPASVERAIYIDSDVVVLGDFKEIWDIDFDDRSFMAVLDNNTTYGDPFGLPANTYFNAGFLVFNLDRIRKVYPKLFDFYIHVLETHTDKVFKLGDQDILNLSYYELNKERSEVKLLDRSWNYSTGVFYKDVFHKNSVEIVSDEDYFKRMKIFPKVVHYTGRKKPWKIKSLHPLKGMYWKYRRIGNFKPTWWEYFKHSAFILGFVHYKDLSLFFLKIGNLRINFTKLKKKKSVDLLSGDPTIH